MTQTSSSAAQILSHHFGGDGGFIDSLRPYRGKIDTAMLVEIASAVRTIKDDADRGKSHPRINAGEHIFSDQYSSNVGTRS